MKKFLTQDNKPNKKKILWLILMILAIAVFTASAIMLALKFIPFGENYDGFKNNLSEPTVSLQLPENPIDFAALTATNDEVCGWIRVDGTIIDYPIMQSNIDRQEDYYINHDLEGNRKAAGSIYIQKANNKDFEDPNTLIYGHNMLNGTMFGQLKKFRNKDFFDQNRYIYIYTPGHIYKYEIMSAFVYDDRHILNSFNFFTDDGYQLFLDECINPTSLTRQVKAGVTADIEDRIITLSTCTANSTERYLVVGVLIEDTKTK